MSEPEVLQPLKTWSHLAGNRRRPTEYEIVSAKLHYHTENPECPFELDPNVAMNEWYRTYREGSPLRHDDWDAFRDPDQIVYRSYNVLQDGAETFVDGVLDEYSEIGHDGELDADWVAVLARVYAPSRYPAHALQMASSYGGQMAPASTITNCFYFQAADEMRVVQHTAYRTVELGRAHPDAGFGEKERSVWETDPAWQPLRSVMEKMLVAWDWGETFAALNLVVKPAFDEAVLRQLGAVGRTHGDQVLGLVNDSHLRDSERSRRWTGALVAMALDVDGNREVLGDWVAKWVPPTEEAVTALLEAVPGADAAAANAAAAGFRSSIGLG